MALLPEVDREHLTAGLYEMRVRSASNSSNHSSNASRNSPERPPEENIKEHRRGSMPADLPNDCPWTVRSPVHPRRRGSDSAKTRNGQRRQTISQPYSMTFEDAFRSRSGTFSAFTDEAEDPSVYRLRNFAVTPKGVVTNQGDSYRPRSDSSSINAIPAAVEDVADEFPPPVYLSAASSTHSSAHTSLSGETTPLKNLRYRVLMSGASEVGKTALTVQFLTSEYVNAHEPLSAEDEDCQDKSEKSVSVLLDGEESELDFLDPDSDCVDDNLPETSPVDAHVIVYDIVDRPSFEKAIDILFALKEAGKDKHQAIVLVGNKSDLVRARDVSTEEGKSIASSYDCKFIETSAGLNLNVNELLVGILTQIRLKEEEATKNKHGRIKHKGRKSLTHGYDKAVHFLSKVFSNNLSKSCDNFQVL